MYKIRIALIPVLLAVGLLAAAPLGAAEWSVDAAHSTVGFSVKHMAISTVRGHFGEFTAELAFDPDKPETWTVQAEIQTASVNTANDKRDDHLRGEDFFDAARHPAMTFVSTGVQMKDETTGLLSGDLTIGGETRPVELDLEYFGTVQDPWGGTRSGFAARGRIDREDFGLTYGGVLETGGLIIGNDVDIAIEVELIRD